jgi:hypothetical protein
MPDSGSDCYYADRENEFDIDQCEQVADMPALYHKITIPGTPTNELSSSVLLTNLTIDFD